MGEIVNLRLARKAKARSEKEAKADQNRLLFGEKKGVRQLREEEKSKLARLLDGGKLEPGKPSGEG